MRPLSCLLALATVAGAAAADPIVLAKPPPEALADPADLVPWPEQAYPRFAAGSAADAGSWLLDAPAGKHGAVRTRPDGRLEFADGTPARFWGSATVYAGSFPEKREEVPILAAAIAATGYNIVRFHHNDITWDGCGYLQGKPASAIAFNPDGIDRLDYFAAELLKRGVYLYVDLVDQRPWTAETGMIDWERLGKLDGSNLGWKGVWPHPAMVAVWKKAATALLSHRNPYTGRTWAEEPGVAVVEIINENGLFWDWGFKVTDGVQKWRDQEWNAWLLKRYGSREALARRWTDATGTCGLFADEDPAKGTVYRPQMIRIEDWDRSNGSKARGACRYNDFFAWLAESAEGFYQEATSHLRGLGYQGAMMGSHELQGPLNQQAEIRHTRTIGAHLYANPRIAWGTRPGVKGVTVVGVDVKSNNWFSNIQRVKVAGASGWNCEWASGASPAFRADANLGVAAASAFHRLDGSVHFAYSHRVPVAKDTLIDYMAWQKRIGMTFHAMHDVPWMAVNRASAAMMLRGDLAPGRYKAHIAYSAEDIAEQNLHTPGINGGSGSIGGAALFLPLIHQVECRFFDTAYDGDADVVFSTGRSASGDYGKAKHAVILGDNPWCDRFHQKRDLAAPARAVCPGLKTRALDQPTEFTLAWPYPQPRSLSAPKLECAIAVASLPPGATPIGLSADRQWTLGWCDDRFLVVPEGRTIDERLGDARWLYRFYLAAAARWKLDLAGNSADAGFYRTDNRQITTDWATGTQLVDSERTQAIAGFAGWRGASATANLSLTSSTPFTVAALTSIDGRAIRESRRMLLTVCGRVQNTGMVLGTNKGGGVEVVTVGEAPILAEAIRGDIALTGLADPSLAVFALDHEGRRLGAVEAKRGAADIAFALSPRWKSIWYEIAPADSQAPAAPAEALAAWPGPEPARTASAAVPKTMPIGEFLALINAKKDAGGDAGPDTSGSGRLVLADMADWKPHQAYLNLKGKVEARDAGEAVLVLDIGKHNPKDWCGGTWFNLAPSGARPEDVLGLAIAFQGDGSMPRNCNITIVLADGRKFQSPELNKHFEDAAWHDILVQAKDFKAIEVKDPKDKDAVPDLGAIKNLTFNVIGPLMESHHVGRLGAIALLTRGQAERRVERLVGLPAIAPLAEAKLAIPLLADARIAADGDFAEPAWKQAVGLAMDEDAVPKWQHVGSFLAEGVRKQGEKAHFWLLATRDGLALAAEVDRGDAAPIVGKPNWYSGDCVELFTDPKLARGKPAKQIFLAYRRPGADRAATSAPGGQVGRVRTPAGYALEALIPWADLGFDGVPSGEFGLDLQVDIGDADGRRMQLTFATGTNEAWVTAARYLVTRTTTP